MSRQSINEIGYLSVFFIAIISIILMLNICLPVIKSMFESVIDLKINEFHNTFNDFMEGGILNGFSDYGIKDYTITFDDFNDTFNDFMDGGVLDDFSDYRINNLTTLLAF